MAKHQKGEMGQIELVFNVIILVFCGSFLMLAYGIERVKAWILPDQRNHDLLAIVGMFVVAIVLGVASILSWFLG